ncbi:MAG: metallophosphoesterase family protein [Nocardiopsaceae bacterium]|nr:metallophosphoesterase family protein [Nocardiopsaceae bacterium]
MGDQDFSRNQHDGADSNVPDHERHGVSRRGFIGGTIAAGAALGAGGVVVQSGFFRQPASAATVNAGTATAGSTVPSLPLPTTTEPEQVRLTWGADPSSEVIVSWSAPGTVKQPAPELAYSTKPITRENPGTLVRPPEPVPLQEFMSAQHGGTGAVSFTDGPSGQTTYHYRAAARVRPGTTYYYRISDGATPPSYAHGSFTTAPGEGRFPYRFSAFGDLGTPDADRSASGHSITDESSDTSYYTVEAIENPGDGGGPPLFHLMLGDLCYGNLAPGNAPNAWRDYAVNVARSAAYRPWMPAIGNHENELGATARDGKPSTTEYWNGPYGNGHYLSRFALPPNGRRNYDGNWLQGSFYSFAVGTVLFISLDADDVTFQGDQISETSTTTYASGLTIPGGTVNTGYAYTGTLTENDGDYSLVPGGRQPNQQTVWLSEQLSRARRPGSGVEMIVVFMHQCPLSSNTSGNGTDLGIRRTWLPLFDAYQVDLVLSGHEHVFERSHPVRGYDNGSYATVTTEFTSDGTTYPVGSKFNTRRPTVAPGATGTAGGREVVDTSKGTVYYILGGGGAISTYGYTTDPETGLRKANVWTTPNGRDAWEDATWSAEKDGGDSHGYAIFDVDPGSGPGETTITVKWFQMKAVPEGGTATLPTTPYSEVTYGRGSF